MRQHLRAHFVRPTAIGVMSVSFILLSLHFRGIQVQPDLLCSMTSTRKLPIKQPKVFKGMPAAIILVIITLMTVLGTDTGLHSVSEIDTLSAPGKSVVITITQILLLLSLRRMSIP